MEKTKVIIERNVDGTFTAVPQHNYKVGYFGIGETLDAAVADLENSWHEAKERLPELPKFEYCYKYDAVSFLRFYSQYLTLTGLQKVTGISNKQLSCYLTGKSKPTERTEQRIFSGIKELSNFFSLQEI